MNIKEKIEHNFWEKPNTLQEIVDFIKENANRDSEWKWLWNSECKYIDLRIDMRDGGFTLSAKGKRISLNQLKWQYSKENPNFPEE
jgi:hypothetical protein